MGCDIHMVYQKVSKQQKREDKLSEVFGNNSETIVKKWEIIDDASSESIYNYQFSSEDRNYYWFGRLSEVRGNGPRITEYGLPEDVDFEEIDNFRWLGDHSYSHVYLDRLLDEDWSEDDKSLMSKFIDYEIPEMVKYCEDNGLKSNEFRILIGYDS